MLRMPPFFLEGVVASPLRAAYCCSSAFCSSESRRGMSDSTGRIAIYYGCADTVTGLAFTTVDVLLDYIKENSL